VLVQRDSVEHLVLLGHGADVVVEAGIPAPQDGSEDDDPGPSAGGFKAAIRSIGGNR